MITLASSPKQHLPKDVQHSINDESLIPEVTDYGLGSAIKNMGLFSKIPIDFKIETKDF